jgi:hypothetical protein
VESVDPDACRETGIARLAARTVDHVTAAPETTLQKATVMAGRDVEIGIDNMHACNLVSEVAALV